MNDILALARPDIVALQAYSHASWDPAFDRLHANELPWRAETDRTLAGLNRTCSPNISPRYTACARTNCCPAVAATSRSTC
jgi:hypothetical protein